MPPSARMSDEAVRKKTGRDWSEWFALLDRAGAKKLDHKGIVAILSDYHPEAGDWWQQMITVAYEQDRGLRAKHQRPDGYQISRSKTISVPLGKLYDAWADAAARKKWLAASGLTVRTATKNKSMRILWKDKKSTLEVNFYARGSTKAQVAVQHSKLASAEEAERFKSYWGKVLDKLENHLGSAPNVVAHGPRKKQT